MTISIITIIQIKIAYTFTPFVDLSLTEAFCGLLLLNPLNWIGNIPAVKSCACSLSETVTSSEIQSKEESNVLTAWF